MSVREYVGARYVPIFAEPLQWDATRTYEPLTVVLYQGNSFTSRQAVPANIDISNTTYWAQTGNYNAQIEQYRAEVQTFDGRITANATAISNEATARQNADATLSQSITNEATARQNADSALAQDITAEETARQNADNALSQAISAEQTARQNADTSLASDISSESAARIAADSAINTALENLEIKETAMEGATVSPFWLGCFAEQTPDTEGHAGSIASNGTYQVMISSRSQQNDMGTVHFININSNESRYLAPKTVLLGHANSICYHPENNVFIVAPEFSYASGSASQWKELLVYNPDFTTMTRVQTPQENSSIQSVAYDHVTGKMYALGIDDILYEVSDSYVFTEIGEIERAVVYNQDFAVNDGIFYNSSPSGFIKYGRVDTCEILGYFNINSLSSNRMFCLGELNGMEFDAAGHLLACGDYSPDIGITTVGLIYSVFQIPLKNSPIFYPSVEPELVISNPTTLQVEVNANIYKLRGLTIQNPNIVSAFSKIGGDFIKVSFSSNVNFPYICLDHWSSVEVRFNGNYTITCDGFRFLKNIHFFGTGNVVVGRFAPLDRTPEMTIETGTTIVSKNGTNTEVCDLFSYGGVIMNGGTAQNSALFSGQNLGTYRMYVISRTPVYTISG